MQQNEKTTYLLEPSRQFWHVHASRNCGLRDCLSALFIDKQFSASVHWNLTEFINGADEVYGL